MTLLFWVVVFFVALVVLVKSADWLLEGAGRVGLALGLSPFIVGVVIVGAGTSFPELASSIAAVWKGATEIVVANTVGSNIANIALIVGVAAVLARRIVVTKNLIDVDLPLLAIGTVFFLGVVWDRTVTLVEAALLLFLYVVHLVYSAVHRDEEGSAEGPPEVLPARRERRWRAVTRRKPLRRRDLLLILVGIVGLVFGAKYLVDAVIRLSELLQIGTGVITITAVAVGTSLPELLVSARAALKKDSEVALGNIFGSNVFNMFVVVGIPGLLRPLAVDAQTATIGIPAMALVTLLFVISGISRRIHLWEGVFYVALYVLFVGKLFQLF